MIQPLPHSEQCSSIKEQLLNAAQGNNGCLLWGSYRTQKYTIREKFRVFDVKPSGTYSNRCALHAYDREMLIVLQSTDHFSDPCRK
jgi:hypothetical protein